MGMFDSVYIKKHSCPKCGEEMSGELQTKSLDCGMRSWGFPDYIPDVDGREVRIIQLHESCHECHWWGEWEGWIENQVLYRLLPPKDIEDIGTLKVHPTDEIRDSLDKIQRLEQSGCDKKSLALSFAVFIWKFHPEKRVLLFEILLDELELTLEKFEKYSVSSCLNPLHHMFGIIGGPQVNYWKLEEKTQAQKDKEEKFIEDAMKKLKPGKKRSAIVDAVDIEELMKTMSKED